LITTIPPIPTKIDEKENKLIKKFREYRQFKINWAERDNEGLLNYRERNYNEVVMPVALTSNIICHPNEHEVNVSFTDQFVRFLLRPSQARTTISDKSKLLGSLASMEFNAATEVAIYLGLTYEELCNLPTKDPDKLKVIFDLGEIIHRLINSDFYERLAKAQEEQMKERAEFRKRILRK
jgi:hypothetical protein